MTEELKPCPFCDAPGKAMSMRTMQDQDTIIYFAACSTDCGGNHLTPEDAAREWNTRPVEDALRARVAELERERDWLSSIVENVEMTELVFAVDKAKALGAQEPPHAAQE